MFEVSERCHTQVFTVLKVLVRHQAGGALRAYRVVLWLAAGAGSTCLHLSSWLPSADSKAAVLDLPASSSLTQFWRVWADWQGRMGITAWHRSSAITYGCNTQLIFQLFHPRYLFSLPRGEALKLGEDFHLEEQQRTNKNKGHRRLTWRGSDKWKITGHWSKASHTESVLLTAAKQTLQAEDYKWKKLWRYTRCHWLLSVSSDWLPSKHLCFRNDGFVLQINILKSINSLI